VHRKYGRSCGAADLSAKPAALYLPINPTVPARERRNRRASWSLVV
jgi:hypothetical protein